MSILGPLTAAAAAYQSARAARQPLREILDSIPRSRASASLLLLGGELVKPLVAYLVVSAYLVGVTAARATSGRPDLGLLAAGAAALAAFAAVGMLVGRTLSRPWTPPLLGGLMWVVAWLVGVGETPLRFLSPLLDGEPWPLQPFRPELGMYQTAWFLALGVAAFSATVLWQEPGRIGASLLLVSLGGAVWAAGSLAGLASTGGRATLGLEYPAACEERGGTTLCLHAAFSDILPEAADVAAEVLDPLRSATGWPTRIVQVGTRADVAAVGADDPEVLAFTGLAVSPDLGFLPDELARQLALAASGAETCPPDEVTIGLAEWLLAEASVPPLGSDGSSADRLGELPDEARDTWLAASIERIRACDAPPLPGEGA